MNDIFDAASKAAEELIAAAKLKAGELLVVGCSSSEILGTKIGTGSDPDTAVTVFNAIYAEAKKHGVFLAAQCCEHLNRAVIIEREAAEKFGLEEVNVIPQPKAGGSFATAAYKAFADPVAVERVRAHAGMDIGGVLIGMQLREVAVPVRTGISKIGEAPVFFARTRPKFVGGERAVYDPSKM